MIIEEIDIRTSEKEAREMTNITMLASSLVKNPKKKYVDLKRKFNNYIIFMILMFIVILTFLVSTKRIDAVLVFLLGAYFILLFFTFLLKISWDRIYKRFNNNNINNIKMIFDNEGIEVQSDNQNCKIKWNQIKFFRRNKYVSVFIPKDIIRTYMLFISSKYYEQVKQYIKDNNIDIDIIEE